MERIINIKNDDKYLNEYIKLCTLEWGSPKTEEQLQQYIETKKDKVLNEDKVISILGLIDNGILIGFISLFKCDCDEKNDLTPWYSTMYVKKEYRGHGYSKVLNDAILNEAIRLGYRQVYLKTNLINYYEKFGARYIETLNNKEKLYYFDLSNYSYNNINKSEG